MAISKFGDNGARLDDAQFANAQILQIAPKVELGEGGEELHKVNARGEKGYVIDALLNGPAGLSTFSWTEWGAEPKYSGMVRLIGVTASVWATSNKSGMWFTVTKVEPLAGGAQK